MKNLAIKVVVTGPNEFYYREEHEWHNLDPLASKFFLSKQAKIAQYVTKASANKEDDGLIAVFDATKDGVPDPQVTVRGISYEELLKFQKMWHDLEGETLGEGEKNLKNRQEKRKNSRNIQ